MKLILLLTLFWFGSTARAAELDPLLKNPSQLWTQSGEDIQKKIPKTLQWMDNSKNRLRFNAVTMKGQS
ncbi:MAG: hypothetical protein LBM70_08775, partial [Victivallales bacterium]|nr:hypothetical protein [Victivallales bacterium]